MRATRKEVYDAIDSEREYQDSKWGDTLSSGTAPDSANPPGSRTLDEYCLYIIGYANDLLGTSSHFLDPEAKLDIVRKVAALGVACMEDHGAPHRK